MVNTRTFGAVQRFFFFVLVAVGLCLAALCTAGCALPAKNDTEAFDSVSVSEYVPSEIPWRPAGGTMLRFDFEDAELPLRYHVVRISLDSSEAPQLRLHAYPGAADPVEAVIVPKKTSAFASSQGCALALNASPFARVAGGMVSIVGIHKLNGTVYSAPNSRYAALGFTGRERGDGFCAYTAAVIKSQTEEACAGYDSVFGGFFCVLWKGEVQEFAAARHDSRCGVGVTEDGTVLYVLAVEGERPSRSRGLSYQQCAQIFKALGCYSALEFDGGGSAELCLDGESVMSYTVGRKQANSFGFSFGP